MLLGTKGVLRDSDTPEKVRRMVGASILRGPCWRIVCEREEMTVFSESDQVNRRYP